ncbi:polyribonucleotide nucleotidyltransferase [Patescibacteria group bacterium]|nr:polyribonucleotide nucleotidyltransferase [Patescibacteria group bacterium]MBU4000084.1 polyribonucleotide nucleotidyltransferase [Patescibacteria group bacterium]MBU4056900.1 polyribonucleotide nucleotidyltransferase [Patescibacteria group bacterium]MBU4368578.1 polyribonucleotide nucleotidyltransferase [Patescibacteria group bacterium]
MEINKFSIEVGGRSLIVESGKLAGLADGAVTVQYGDTVILATAVMSKNMREGIDFFPLMVDYEEKLYAAGKIKGSRFIKRETRPSDEAILSGRLIDRTIRPLFPEGMRNDVQVIITVLSVDGENDPDITAIIGASLALGISNIPWSGPVAAVRMGKMDGKYIVNPKYDEREKGGIDLVVSGAGGKINMAEARAFEAKEEEIFEAELLAEKEIDKLVKFQEDIIKKISKAKTEVVLIKPSAELKSAVEKFLEDKVEKRIYNKNKEARTQERISLEQQLKDFVKEKFGEEKMEEANAVMEEMTNIIVHENIIKRGKRPDGRALNQVRELTVEAGILPRTHGSAIFQRGTTQALSVVTLGAPGDEQTIEGIEIDGTKRFMHHYSFPPYSVGEVKPMRGPGRREIGHGALVEKALEVLVPPKETFPYTVRVVSEILSSNGSSSMASVCGGSLALMDAGVPIKTQAAGIAMGLMSDKEGNYKILTDIQGPEDHFGDMDLKVAGTKNGVSALQMDVKIEGITSKIFQETILQAKEARLFILGEMNKVLSAPRPEMSKYAPRITSFNINPDKIRDVIGPGGKVINEIIEATSVTIDIDDSGLVMITSKDAEAAKKATKWIMDLVREAKPGEVYEGKVTRIIDFGAFVEIFPGTEGLLHISEIAPYRVSSVSDVLKVGDAVKVRVKAIDHLGRVNLTAKEFRRK